MYTRRGALMLATASTLLATDSFGQENTIQILFNNTSAELREPTQVRQLYESFGYYVQLLELSRKLSPDKVSAARKTYVLLDNSITRNKGIFNAETASAVRPKLEAAYGKSRDELLGFLQEVGIQKTKLGGQIIEMSLIGMMWYQAVATGVTDVYNHLLFCCWPFCFKEPT